MGFYFIFFERQKFKIFYLDIYKRRKTVYIKIKDENPSIKSTRQMRTRENTTQQKKKQKTKNKK
jgi:hypothetical protein